VYRKLEKYDKAKANQVRALAIRERHASGDDPAVADALHNLAATLWWDGKYSEAESLYMRSLAMRQRLHPGNDPAVAMSLTHLAACRLRMGKAKEARDLYQQALDMRRALYGAEHEEIAQSLNNLAKISLDAGQFDQAEDLFRQALTMIRKLNGDADKGTASASQNLGDCLIRRGEAAALAGDSDNARAAGEAALEPLERALQIRTRMFPQGHQLVGSSLGGLARGRLLSGGADNLAKAHDLARQAVDMIVKSRKASPDHPDVGAALETLGMVQLAQGDVGAATSLQQSLAIAEKTIPPSPLYVARLQRELAQGLLLAQRPGDARAALEKALEVLRRIRGDNHRETRLTAQRLFDLYTDQGDTPAAEALRALAHPDQ
jgi:tetratricopeptide (TPR) repeat protein